MDKDTEQIKHSHTRVEQTREDRFQQICEEENTAQNNKEILQLDLAQTHPQFEARNGLLYWVNHRSIREEEIAQLLIPKELS